MTTAPGAPLGLVYEASTEDRTFDGLAQILGAHTLFVLVIALLTFILRPLGLENEALLVGLSALLMLFFVGSLFTAYRLLRLEATLVWMPITIFVLSSALFYGFGPLCFALGSEGTKTYLALRLIKASPDELVRASKLSMVGILFVFAGALATLRIAGHRLVAARRRERMSPFSAEMLTVAFLGLGLVLKYGLWYPSTWGLIDVTVPGFMALFTALAALGFGLFAFVAFTRRGFLIALFFALWLIDFLFTTLAFAKIDLMLAMVLPIAGYFLATRKFVPTGLAVCLAIATYSFAQPMVTYARFAGIEDFNASGYFDRAETIYTYIIERPETPQNIVFEGAQRWWTRLEFSAKQAYAMNLHDRGVTSSSLLQLPILFIPRVVWPDKPELRGPGQDFYFLLTGRDTNRMSISVYGDLFWQFGWLGVLLVAPVIGMILVLMTNKLLPHIRSRDFIYFPLVLIGLRFALIDPNKYVINGVLSTATFFLTYALIIGFAVRLTIDKESRRDAATLAAG